MPAASNGHDTVVWLLLQYGADVELADNDNMTPITYAVANGFEAIVNLLLGYGASTDAQTKNEK